jgi:cell division inhibitor SepF
MGGALRKTMLYLGLADDQRPDGEYLEEYDEELEPVRDDDYQAEVTPLHRDGAAEAYVGGDLRRITTIHPRSYNDARLIGEAFRGGTPVIMNLSDMDDADAKRLVDFAAGLVFAVRGTIERVTNKVFLLSPPNVSVAAEDKQRIAENGFFNQS